MYYADITFYRCLPLNAKITIKTCDGMDSRAEPCRSCGGAVGPSVTLKIAAQAPYEKVLIPNMYGGFDYVN